jgi:hypothetical protein
MGRLLDLKVRITRSVQYKDMPKVGERGATHAGFGENLEIKMLDMPWTQAMWEIASRGHRSLSHQPRRLR